MKYFFLSDSWTTGRVWEFGGLWNELAWHREPHLQQRSLCIKENGDTLHLYEAEEAILMVEVMPKDLAQPTIGQVRLKRLLSAEQAITRLCQEEHIFQSGQGVPSTSPQALPLADRPTTVQAIHASTSHASTSASTSVNENSGHHHGLTTKSANASRNLDHADQAPVVQVTRHQADTDIGHTMTTNAEPTAIN